MAKNGIEVGRAYVQIVPSAEGISGRISKVLDPESKKAGESAGKSISSRIIKGIAAAGIGVAITKSIKAAIDEGAALQQSIGGVETLFKNSADAVKNYANEAYKSAGLSANAYMEQVTSFSASLLQSLDGDTEKAASYANKAVIDMADNANKMGTGIESIQSAYQGFAKQNYTMLDNLKLGYGGTKSEMMRLIQDSGVLGEATKDLTLKNFDQKVSFDTIVDAIHVMQGNLGIAGATAEEASTTISGSFSSLKASVSNLLGTWALGEDITPALDGLYDSASTFLFDNLMPMVGDVVKNLPTLVGSIITDGLPQFLDSGMTMLEGLAQGLIDNLPTMVSGAVSVITTLVTTLISKLPQVISMGVQLIGSLAKGLLQSIPQVGRSILDVASALIKAFKEVDWLQLGSSVINGIKEGLLNGVGKIVQSAKEVAKSALDSAKKFLGIHSPSKVAEKIIGKNYDLGIAKGISGNIKPITYAVNDVSDELVGDIALTRQLSNAPVFTPSYQTEADTSTNNKLIEVLDKLSTMGIYLDDGTLAGHMTNDINKNLNNVLDDTRRGLAR